MTTTPGLAAASTGSADPVMRMLGGWPLVKARRPTAVSLSIVGAAVAFTVLSLAAATQVAVLSPHAASGAHRADAALLVASSPAEQLAVPVPIPPKPRGVALSFIILPAGWAVVASGAAAKLRGRRRELRTLRALGWGPSEIRRLLIQAIALLALATSLAVGLGIYLCEAVLSRTSPSGWDLLAIPAVVAMTIAAVWWPVRQATAAADPLATAPAHRPADWTRRQPWMLRQPIRNLLYAPKRTVLSVFVIAASCGALGQDLTMRWAFGGTLVSSWLGHPLSWQEDPIDTACVLTTLVIAVATVAELDRLSAHQLAIDWRTLQAIGWSAHRAVRPAASEAILVGLAGGIAAGMIDVAGGIVIAHRMPAGMLAAATVVMGTGVLVSLVGAGLSAVWSRHGTGVPE